MAISGIGTPIPDFHPDQIQQNLREAQENNRNAEIEASRMVSLKAKGDDVYLKFFQDRVEQMIHKLKTEERKLVNSHEQDALAHFREACATLALVMGWQ
jgi:hypothetical protein